MSTAIIQPANRKRAISTRLIYEEMDGKPLYYRGYQEVLKRKKTPEDIMGSSGLQSIIITCIVKFLLRHEWLDKRYHLFTNELGLHVSPGNNLSADIALYPKSQLKNYAFTFKYLDIPPETVIEVDTKADLIHFEEMMDYVDKKTKKLLHFGVKKVIWILSAPKKIIVAQPGQPWLLMDWDAEIILTEDCAFSVVRLLTDEGITLA